MIEYLPQALSSLNTALSISKTLIGVHDKTKAQEQLMEFNRVVIDAQNQIISARNEQSSMVSEIDKLEKECMRLKDWSAERERYTRKQIASGIFVYIENDFMGNFQDAHKYCCNCFDKTIKSTLQQSIKVIPGFTRVTALVCPNSCPDLEFRVYSKNT
jgi:hypothetical protein